MFKLSRISKYVLKIILYVHHILDTHCQDGATLDPNPTFFCNLEQSPIHMSGGVSAKFTRRLVLVAIFKVDTRSMSWRNIECISLQGGG